MSQMKLSEPVRIPDAYRETVLAFLRDYLDDEVWRLRNHFGIELEMDQLPASDDDYLRLMVAESCEQIARAAVGESEGLDRGEVHDHAQGIVEKLFGVPGASEYDIPRAFWQTPFGNMVALALVWATGDTLVTVQQAVDMTGKTHSYFGRHVASGKLTSYIDLSEPNPTRRTRLLLSEVERIAPKKKKKSPR